MKTKVLDVGLWCGLFNFVDTNDKDMKGDNLKKRSRPCIFFAKF